jgi:hypothetical protein
MPTATMRRLLGPVAVIGVLAGIMAAAPAADAKIIAGQSIAGVKLGATKAQVKAALRGQTHEQPLVLGAELFYSGFLRIHFKSGHVDKLLSYSKKQQTAHGITIGSSRAQVKSTYPQARCVEGEVPAYHYCVMAGHAGGRKSYTGFLFEATGGVVEIELGYGSVTQALREP